MDYHTQYPDTRYPPDEQANRRNLRLWEDLDADPPPLQAWAMFSRLEVYRERVDRVYTLQYASLPGLLGRNTLGTGVRMSDRRETLLALALLRPPEMMGANALVPLARRQARALL